MGKHQYSTIVTGLPAYSGEWSYAQAAHLLRRTTFGPTKTAILAAAGQGMAASVAALLANQLPPEPPLNPGVTEDPFVAVGESWVDAPVDEQGTLNNYRVQSFRSWIFQQAMTDETIKEKMVLFWQNHFGLTFNGNARVRYMWNSLLREFATGNFRELVKQVTVHPAMLVFLNGTQSSANSPNENYGRELLELYTIGKGPQIAEGDYSNYTEDDVRALTRALTGWRIENINPQAPGLTPGSFFQSNRHDTGDKVLSYHFNNQVIQDAQEDEYKNVVDILLNELETARYMVREFYRYFVYYDISDQEETEVIEPLAQFFYDSDYDVAATLENLFSSQHFYDILNRGPLIKDPMNYIMSIVRPFGFDHVTDATLASDYLFYQRLYARVLDAGMDYLSPPTVSGWEAWYQAPSYHRNWINASTLQQRTRNTDQFTDIGLNGGGGVRYSIDFVGWIANLENPFDPNTLIEEITRILLPQPLVQEQLDALKDFLIPGLPDFEWTDEYGAYLSDPTNNMLFTSVENKLKDLFRAIFGLAEFHLS
ncbi:hypothetical protein CEQ90_08505 [Lewinellaceae bacterium SD302]|nr:hypothetical protein CEQ90_08505 [Lewinellaceae bacterium SD302]